MKNELGSSQQRIKISCSDKGIAWTKTWANEWMQCLRHGTKCCDCLVGPLGWGES